MCRESGYVQERWFHRPAKSPDCDPCLELPDGLQANAAIPSHEEIHSAPATQLAEARLEIWCSPYSAENRPALRRDQLAADRFDGARAGRERTYAHHPRKSLQQDRRTEPSCN